MTLLLEVLAFAAIIGGVLLVISGRGDPMPDAEPDHAEIGLPAGVMGADEVADIRFATGLRGYRMQEVDDVLDRLALELDRRDQAIATLAGRLGVDPAATVAAVVVEPRTPFAQTRPAPQQEPEPAPEPDPGTDILVPAGPGHLLQPDMEPPVAATVDTEPPPATEPISTGAETRAQPVLPPRQEDRTAAPLAWSWTPEPIAETLPPVGPGTATDSAGSAWMEPQDAPDPAGAPDETRPAEPE